MLLNDQCLRGLGGIEIERELGNHALKLDQCLTFDLLRYNVPWISCHLPPCVGELKSMYQLFQERIQLETSRLYKQAGVNPLAGT